EGAGMAPPPPRFIEGWTSQMDRPPDQIIEAPIDFELPAKGVIPEFTVWAKVPFGKERFIEAIELRPTSRAVVHHASVFRGKMPRAGARVGLWFSRGDVQNEVITWTVTDKVLVNGKEVGRDAGGPQLPNIPPRDPHYTVEGQMRVKDPLTLYALWPHMHNRG